MMAGVAGEAIFCAAALVTVPNADASTRAALFKGEGFAGPIFSPPK